MMRRVFASAMVLSVTGAILLGGVFAWRTDQKVSGDAEVGYQAFESSFEMNEFALLGPNGNTTGVGEVSSRNRGDFIIEVTGGDVTIDKVTNIGIGGEPGPGNPACGVGDFSGDVIPQYSVGWGQLLVGNQNWSAEQDINLTVEWDAPNSCMGAQVFYTVTIYGENPLSEAPAAGS